MVVIFFRASFLYFGWECLYFIGENTPCQQLVTGLCKGTGWSQENCLAAHLYRLRTQASVIGLRCVQYELDPLFK
jgi:hypothetical protein